MLDKDKCFTYELVIPKLSKANSFIASGRQVYVKKADCTGKSSKLFVAYDYETKIQLLAYWNKEDLIKYIQSKDLTSLGGDVQMSLF